MSYSVYLVRCPRGLYCGITTNPERRLRQHKGELKGGARSVKMLGGAQEMRVLKTGLTKSDAMSQERYIKGQAKSKKQDMFDKWTIL